MNGVIFRIRKTWAVFATLFTIYWLPKDAQEYGEAAKPWQRAWAMVDQTSALWLALIVASLWIVWTDLRPFWREWRGPKFPDRHREICSALADEVSKLHVAAVSAGDWAPLMDKNPWAMSQARLFKKSANHIDRLLPQIHYDQVAVLAVNHYASLCMRLVVAITDKAPVGELVDGIANLSGPLFEMLHGGKRLSLDAIPALQWPACTEEKTPL